MRDIHQSFQFSSHGNCVAVEIGSSIGIDFIPLIRLTTRHTLVTVMSFRWIRCTIRLPLFHHHILLYYNLGKCVISSTSRHTLFYPRQTITRLIKSVDGSRGYLNTAISPRLGFTRTNQGCL